MCDADRLPLPVFDMQMPYAQTFCRGDACHALRQRLLAGINCSVAQCAALRITPPLIFASAAVERVTCLCDPLSESPLEYMDSMKCMVQVAAARTRFAAIITEVDPLLIILALLLMWACCGGASAAAVVVVGIGACVLQ